MVKSGTIVTYANRRQLPDVPDDASAFSSQYHSSETASHSMSQMNIDDDYAEIGPGGSFEEPKFDPQFELNRAGIGNVTIIANVTVIANVRRNQGPAQGSETGRVTYYHFGRKNKFP